MGLENKKTALSPRGTRLKWILCGLAVLLSFVASLQLLGLDMGKFLSRLENVPGVLARLIAVDFSQLGDILAGMGTSFALAITALAGGFALALPLSFLSAENIAPSRFFSKVLKSGIAFIRAVPSLVWVLMVVASIGFGNTGGMIGLMFPVTGFLTKSFAAAIEEQGSELIEALRSTGAGWLSIIVKGLLPTVFPVFVSWLAIRLEANLAESISLGMVGVGGVGMLLSKAIKKYDYAGITTIILVIFVCMLLLELGTTMIRKKMKERSV